MRIATWNLESARPLPKFRHEREHALRQAMANVDADVWILTETWLDFGPGTDYRRIAQSGEASDLPAASMRRWATIWAKSSIESRTLDIVVQADRLAGVRIERYEKLPLIIFGTVLPWRSDSLWRGDDGFCSALAEQSDEWTRSQEAYRPAILVVAGDFNQAMPYVLDFSTKRGDDALARVLDKHGLECPTQGMIPGQDRPWIDHICISRDALPPQGIVARSWPIPVLGKSQATDHWGAVVDVEWNDCPDFA